MGKPGNIGTRRLIAALIFALLAGTAQVGLAGSLFENSDQPESLLPAEEAFPLQAMMVSRRQAVIRWTTPPGYYLYRDKIRVQSAQTGGRALELSLPDGEIKQDEYFGEQTVYYGMLEALVDFPAPVTGDITELTIDYQGCADAGICYPPQRITLSLDNPTDE